MRKFGVNRDFRSCGHVVGPIRWTLVGWGLAASLCPLCGFRQIREQNFIFGDFRKVVHFASVGAPELWCATVLQRARGAFELHLGFTCWSQVRISTTGPGEYTHGPKGILRMHAP